MAIDRQNPPAKAAGKTLYSTRAIANLLCLGERRVQQLTKEGVLPAVGTGSGRGYSLIPTVQAYIKYLRDEASGRNYSEREKELKEQKLRAEIALKESQGETTQLRRDIMSGKYIPVEEVELDYSRFFVSFKKFALALPGRLASGLGTLVDPVEARRIEKELQADVVKLLRGFVAAGSGGDHE